ncbi:MAG: DUF1499 domain-containing protein [Chloroflexota bacterium]
MKRAVVGGIMLVLCGAVLYPLSLAAVTLISTPPAVVGVGDLADCPSADTCVSSLATESEIYIAPIAYDGDMILAQTVLVQTLASRPRTVVLESNDGYIYAEARTPILRFVDDLEFIFNPTRNQIDMRASSRVGTSDNGRNRRQLEAIRDEFTQNLRNTLR